MTLSLTSLQLSDDLLMPTAHLAFVLPSSFRSKVEGVTKRMLTLELESEEDDSSDDEEIADLFTPQNFGGFRSEEDPVAKTLSTFDACVTCPGDALQSEFLPLIVRGGMPSLSTFTL
mmetsp:Transcript_7335/g.11655  ORF Transcript_7335/g.11655 Transcript_7335/m.11655 type:complete len:117 (+) Transcript_7335:445-795(+)